MTPEDVARGVVLLIFFTMLIAIFHSGPEQAAPGVHVVCAAPCSGVILWEGDAARADYDDGQWTVCATSAPCASKATRVRTSAACVVTPLVEAEP